MKVIENKRIILGVTGSIAAYKIVTLASSLTKAGALIDVILTDAASKLVSPITFSSVTGRKAYIDDDLWKVDDHVLHIELGEKNDALLIAPATANTIAKLTHGMADNLLTLTALASRTPPLVAPAMDGGMFSHPATQENLDILKNRGVEIWGPAAGHLASGLSGKGRMLEPDQLLGYLRCWLGRNGKLKGKKVVISAGGTQEPIDPVRVIGNKSSGKQGYAIAQAALDQGAQVILISAPVALPEPIGARLIPVTTANEMAEVVFAESKGADLLIMAAAVADYKPTQKADHKIKKDQGGLNVIHLEKTVDILKEVATRRDKNKTGPTVVIGFAAETENLFENAKSKLEEKKLDLIAANDVSREDCGIGSDKNQVILIWKDGQTKELPVMEKSAIADELIQEAAKLLL
jgi:phosphopantothenoylcysteine decarboxylase / phosphopantothenate---cysteine ligase